MGDQQVERWNIDILWCGSPECECSLEDYPHADGLWVRYSDHASRVAALQQEARQLREALQRIAHYVPDVSEAQAERNAAFEAAKGCPKCAEYMNHPVSQGICSDHWRAIYAAEDHQKHIEKCQYIAISMFASAILESHIRAAAPKESAGDIEKNKD